MTGETDKLADLERRVEDLERRDELIEMFLDSEHRERHGVTVDQIREIWRARRAKRGDKK